MGRPSRLGSRGVNASNVHFVKLHMELMEAAARLDRARAQAEAYSGKSKAQQAILDGIVRDVAPVKAATLDLATRLLK